jgi:hypothetical protein
MLNKNRNGWILAAAVAVALAGGVAWAAQTQAIELRAGPSCLVAVDVIPGSDGEVVFKDRDRPWDDKEDLKIGFDPTGELSVNNRVVATYDGAHLYRVTALFYESGEGWACDLVVRDLTSGTDVVVDLGRDDGDSGPAECTVTAETILSLTSG